MTVSIFESSCKILSQMNIAPSVKYKDTATMLNELIQKRDALLESYHTDVSNLKQLNIASKNIDILLSLKEVEANKNKDRHKTI